LFSRVRASKKKKRTVKIFHEVRLSFVVPGSPVAKKKVFKGGILRGK